MSNLMSAIGDWAEDVISSLGGDEHDWEALPRLHEVHCTAKLQS